MDMKRICKNQVEEAKAYQRTKSEELGYELGEAAIIEWIDKYAAEYRAKHNKVYGQIVKKVTESADIINILIGTDLDIDTREKIVRVICDKFTEIWTKEMAISGKSNKHIDEI